MFVIAPGPKRLARASDDVVVAELSLAAAAGVGEKNGSLAEADEEADEAEDRNESNGDAASPLKNEATDDPPAEAAVDRDDEEDEVSEEKRMGSGMSEGRSAEETSVDEPGDDESLPARPRFSRRFVGLGSFLSLDEAGESHSQFVEAKSEVDDESNVTLVMPLPARSPDFCCSSGLPLAAAESDGGAKLSNLITDASMLICTLFLGVAAWSSLPTRLLAFLSASSSCSSSRMSFRFRSSSCWTTWSSCCSSNDTVRRFRPLSMSFLS